MPERGEGMGNVTNRPLAYSIAEGEEAWSWRVYDVDGGVIASGSAASKLGAQHAVHGVYEAVAPRAPRPLLGMSDGLPISCA